MSYGRLYTIRFEARDGTRLSEFGNQYRTEIDKYVVRGLKQSDDTNGRYGPRSKNPIARIVIEIQE